MSAIKPIQGIVKYTTAQAGEPELAPRVPFRICLCAGSNKGKTTTLVDLITNPKFYKNTFQRVVLVSPSLGIDDSLNPILAHMKSLGQDVESDSIITWDDFWLQQKLDVHRKIVEFQKLELKHTKSSIFMIANYIIR